MNNEIFSIKLKAIIGLILFVTTFIVTKIEIYYRFIPDHSYFGVFIIMLNVILSIYLAKDYITDLFKY